MAPTSGLRRQAEADGPGPPASLAFDLDGTLVDARLRQVGVAREALEIVTQTALDETRFWRAKRSGASTAEALCRLGWADEVADEVARLWGERIEADEWLDQDRALPGVAGALARWRRAGAAVTVITARRRPEGARRSIRAAGLEQLVDGLIVVSPADPVAAKADALAGLGAAGFIGDSDSDGQAARAAGVAFVAVSTGQRTRSYLDRRGHRVSASLSAAMAILENGRAPHPPAERHAVSASGPEPRI